MKIWIFNDQIHKKGPELVILVPGGMKSSRPGSFFLMKNDFKVVEAIEVSEAAKVNEGA